MFLAMLIPPLEWKFKMECLSILIAKMNFIVWLIIELSETAIDIYTLLKIAVLEVLCKISFWICGKVLPNR